MAFTQTDRQTDRLFIVCESHRNLPYDCIKDTSKIAHDIIHEHIIKHAVLAGAGGRTDVVNRCPEFAY